MGDAAALLLLGGRGGGASTCLLGRRLLRDLLLQRLGVCLTARRGVALRAGLGRLRLAGLRALKCHRKKGGRSGVSRESTPFSSYSLYTLCTHRAVDVSLVAARHCLFCFLLVLKVELSGRRATIRVLLCL